MPIRQEVTGVVSSFWLTMYKIDIIKYRFIKYGIHTIVSDTSTLATMGHS